LPRERPSLDTAYVSGFIFNRIGTKRVVSDPGLPET
jgi:hypothetical protein